MNVRPLTIQLIAPSACPPEMTAMTRGIDLLESMGHTVLNRECTQRKYQRFAGSDAERVNEINSLVNLSERVDVVLAIRGGYGLSRLLPQIDFAAIVQRLAKTGTKVVGHSDFTAFHLGLFAAGLALGKNEKSQLGISYAGPMLGYDFGAEVPSQFTLTHFTQMMNGPSDQIEIEAENTPQQTDFSATGILWGGNLAMLNSLVGTPYLPKVGGGILFLEDINEHPYRIERMILQLHQAGVLAQQQAILLGDFSSYKLTPFDNGYDFAVMLEYLRSVLPIPVFTDLPFGHCPEKLTLPVGKQVTLTSSNSGYRLKFA